MLKTDQAVSHLGTAYSAFKVKIGSAEASLEFVLSKPLVHEPRKGSEFKNTALAFVQAQFWLQEASR